MNRVKVADSKTDMKRGVDYIGVTVNFIVHDGSGKILLQKRSQNCRDEQGRWDIGGGALEFGEKLIDAVKREVKEELTVVAEQIEFLMSYEALRDNEGTPTHWMAFVHSVLIEPAQVKIGEPHKIDEIGWFGLDNLPEPMHSMFPNALKVAKEYRLIS